MSKLERVAFPVARRSPPLPGEIEFWICQLTDFPLGPAIEDEDGKSYRQAMRFRQRFVLRLLLGAYLNCPGKSVRFEYGPAGKPQLAASQSDGKDGNDGNGLNFNVSHSGDWMAVALASDLKVGIDIEAGRELKRPSSLAQRSFSAPEAEWLLALPTAEQTKAFFELWTRREALVKAVGGSLFASLRDLELDPQTGKPLRLPESWPSPESWNLRNLNLPDGLIAALAAPSQEVSICGYLLDCSAGV